jgi:hypothetical protein
MMGLVGEEVEGMRIDMRAAMAGMGGRGMMRGGGMMNRNMQDRMKDMMGDNSNGSFQHAPWRFKPR